MVMKSYIAHDVENIAHDVEKYYCTWYREYCNIAYFVLVTTTCEWDEQQTNCITSPPSDKTFAQTYPYLGEASVLWKPFCTEHAIPRGHGNKNARTAMRFSMK